MRGSVPESVSARTVIAVASMAPASPDDPPRQSDEQVGAQCCECYVLHDLHGKGVRQAMARSAVSARARCAEQRAGHFIIVNKAANNSRHSPSWPPPAPWSPSRRSSPSFRQPSAVVAGPSRLARHPEPFPPPNLLVPPKIFLRQYAKVCPADCARYCCRVCRGAATAASGYARMGDLPEARSTDVIAKYSYLAKELEGSAAGVFASLKQQDADE